jgi:class 3 adenylate cyclase
MDAADRSVVGLCVFVRVAGLADLRDLQRASDRCAAAAQDVLGRRGGRVERLLYDRVGAVFAGPPEEVAVRAVAAFVEVREAAVVVGAAFDDAELDVAAALAYGEPEPRAFGRAHILARALAGVADAGELLVDDALRKRLGTKGRCEPAGAVASGIRAWRVSAVLSGS